MVMNQNMRSFDPSRSDSTVNDMSQTASFAAADKADTLADRDQNALEAQNDKEAQEVISDSIEKPSGATESTNPTTPPAAAAPGGGAGGAHHGMPPIPDGGLRAWLDVLGAWMVLFATFGYLNAFGVYQEYYQTYYIPDKSSSDVSWIGSFQLFLQFAMGMVTGRLFDEGYFRYLISAGSILYIVCIMMVSLAKQYYSIFLAQGLGLGLSNGLLFLPSVGSISHHFMKRRSLATGIAVSGSSIGGIVFPIMLNNLFKKQGFESSVRASGYLILGCLVIANLTMSTRLPPRKQRPAHLQAKADVKAILHDVPFWITVFGVTFVMLGLFYPFFYLQVYASAKGLSSTFSFYTLAILNGSSIFGRVIPNFIADKAGSFNLIIPCVFMSGIMMWVLLACNSVGGVVAFAIFYGFFSGAYVSLLPGTCISFANGFAEIGIRMGFTFAVVSIAALVGTPITGQLLGHGPDFAWWKASTFSGCVVLTGGVLLTIARSYQVKRKGKQLV